MEQICRFTTTILVTAKNSTQPVQWVAFANFAGGTICKHGATSSTLYVVTRNPITTSARTLYDSNGSVVQIAFPGGASALPLPKECFGCTEIGFVTLDTSGPDTTFSLTLKG